MMLLRLAGCFAYHPPSELGPTALVPSPEAPVETDEPMDTGRDANWDLECRTDVHEPNDGFEEAADMVDALTRSGVEWQNPDFYRFTLSPGETTLLDLEFDDSLGDVDVVLWANGQVVDVGVSTTDDEHVQYTNPSSSFDAEMVLEVVPVAYGSGCVPVTIQRVLDSPSCPPEVDEYEPNDTLTSATVVDGDTSRAGHTGPGDVDFYRFDVPADTFVAIEVNEVPISSLDLLLYAPDGSLMASSEGPVVVGFGLAAGSYTVGVFSNHCEPYVLDWFVEPAPNPSAPEPVQPGCPVDPLEPNDSPADATQMYLGQTQHGVRIEPGETDVFAVGWVGAESVLDVHVLFDHLEGDINARLVNADGMPLGPSWVGQSTDDDEVLEGGMSGPQQLGFVEVSLNGLGTGPCNSATYDIRFR